MKIDFILPDIGEGIVECELVEWHVSEGQHIQEDQPVADVMTDKALVEITAMHTGTVSKLYCQKGDIAKVHAPLFEIEVASDDAAGTSSTAEEAKSAPMQAQTATSTAGNNTPAATTTAHSGKALASPASSLPNITHEFGRATVAQARPLKLGMDRECLGRTGCLATRQRRRAPAARCRAPV